MFGTQMASCVTIPRKIIVLIMLSVATMPILFIMLLEVQNILLRSLPQRNKVAKDANSQLKVGIAASNLSNGVFMQPVLDQKDRDTNLSLTKPDWNSDATPDLFQEHSYCLDRPYLLILVTSSPDNFERREAIRRSWADVQKWRIQQPELKSQTLFLVGRSSAALLNMRLKNESETVGDLVIGDYLDTYRNLTLKVMHGFTWALRHCKPEYLLKTDDDCYVNVPLLLQFLWKFNPVKTNLYAGKVQWSGPVIRDRNSRWYVSSLEYPRARYAPYASGAGYIFSQDVLKKLVAFSNKVQVFPNEDAYVGAVLNAAGVRPTYSARFLNHSGPWQTCNVLYLFVVHRVKASRQHEHQEMANKAMEHCSVEHIVKDWV